MKMGSQPLPTDSLGILDRAQYIKTDAALAQEPPGVPWGRGGGGRSAARRNARHLQHYLVLLGGDIAVRRSLVARPLTGSAAIAQCAARWLRGR